MSFDYIKDPLDEIIRIIGDKRERKKPQRKRGRLFIMVVKLIIKLLNFGDNL